MRAYSLSSRILYRFKRIVNYINNSFNTFIQYKMSRDNAKRIRKQVISKRDQKIVDRKLKKEIRAYCQRAFGSASYWPWIALYTEINGEYREGWMPDDYYRFDLLPKMNPEKFMRMSESKTMDHKLFKGFIIDPLLFRLNGIVYDSNFNFISESEVKQVLNDLNDEIIIKPEAGRSGNQIIFKNSQDVSLNELPVDRNLLFQKVVKQHTKLNKLHPHSINTFRVSTYLDKGGIIKVKFIIVRFGIGGSRVDNASRGGGWIFVNSDGSVEPQAYDYYGRFIGTEHPDSGTKYSELEFPFVDKVVAFCKKAHRTFPYTRIIGWDVYVNNKGEPELIEWNANNPFFWAIEARFGPLYKEITNC